MDSASACRQKVGERSSKGAATKGERGWPFKGQSPISGGSNRSFEDDSPRITPTKPSERLSLRHRLTRPAQFQETYAQGRRWVGPHMVLWLREGPDAGLRLGVVASKKVGNAVHRNRAKRRLREAYRRQRDQFSGPYDVVLVARRGLPRAPWDEVARELFILAKRAGIARAPADGGEGRKRRNTPGV